MNAKEFNATGPDSYAALDGFTMQREEGLTPNGNKLNGRWVLRDPQGVMIDFDQYCSDLSERYGYSIKFPSYGSAMQEEL